MEEKINVNSIAPNVEVLAEKPTTTEAIRKAEFERIKKKIFTDHDGLFRRLAQ